MKALLLALLVACGGGDGMPDGAIDPDGLVDAPPNCELPAIDAPWLSSSLQTWITQLTAAPRATDTQRETARTYLRNELTAMGWTPQTHQYASGANVYATIPATTGSEMQIVVGAHFDTVSGTPGASDNATGTAVVLAVARYLKDTPCRRAPVIVVFVDQEEAGLFGSRAFAQMLDRTKTRAVHTIDQVGYDNDNDRRFELEQPTAALETEWRAAAMASGVPVTTTQSGGTDHVSFRDQGYAAIGLTEEYVGGDTSPFRHLSSDTAATVKMSYLADAAKLTARVILAETQ